jgi:cytochrome P450
VTQVPGSDVPEFRGSVADLQPQYPDGSLWSLRRRRIDPLGFLDHLAARGDFVPFTLARRPAILLNRPAYVSMVLMTQAARFQKGHANKRAQHFLGNGLLTAEAPTHAVRRRLIQPAFGRQRLEAYAPVMVARTRAMCEGWHCDQVVDLSRCLGQLTFGIVGEAVSRAVAVATASIDPLVSLVAPLRGVRVIQARLRAIAAALANASGSPPPEGSLLALLDAHGAESETRDQRLDDILTILLAGHDTITNALTWTLLLLSSRPQVEERIVAELVSALGGSDPCADDLPRLPYTRAVFAESLRLYPPAWVLARQAVESQQLDEGVIPAGALVLVSQYLLHRDERYFERPLSYEPDRWLPPHEQDRPPLAYFPFGAGPRSCIGEAFGWMEGVLVLATIAQRWKLRPVVPAFPDIEPRITLRPRQRVLMRVSLR